MNKTFKKTLSVALCIAFSGLQMSLADVLTGGTFAGRDVLNGTGAQIKGHTAGLTGLTTNGMDATLVFGANTRIDWSKLNVDRGQTLYFNNGNYGVLNNVVGGSMSKFAGSIKADNGKIVISNPNGILFQGGKFESLGGLVLTAAKYQDMNIDENTNFNSLDFSRSASGTVSQFGNIDITNRSVLKAGDIEVHGFGVNVENSQLTADNSVLVTADGMHYIAYERPNLQTQEELHRAELDNKILMTDELKERVSDRPLPSAQHIDPSHVVTDDHKIINKIDFDQLQKPLEVHPGLNIAGSAITASDGTITLVSNTTANIKNSTFNGNTSVASTNAEKGLINIDNSKFYGDLSTSTSGLEGVVSNISKSEVSGDLDVNGNLYLTKSTVDGDLIVSDTQVGALYQAGNGTMNSGYGVNVTSSTIGGDVDINSVDNVYLSGSEVSGHSDIYSAKDVNLTRMVMGSADIEAGNRVGLFSQGSGITFNGNVNLKGNTIQLGETGVDYIPVSAMGDNQITVNGNLTANAQSTIGYTATVTADRINMTSKNSSIVQGNANNFQGKLVADSINLTARKGGVMALDASKGGSGEYAAAMKGDYNPTGSASDYQEATLATRTEGATLNYNVRSDLTSIHSEAANTVVTGSGRTVNVSADGEILANGVKTTEDATFKGASNQVLNVNIGTDLNVEATAENGKSVVHSATVGGDLNSEGRLSMNSSTVGGKLTNHNEYGYTNGTAVLIQYSNIGDGVDIDSGVGCVDLYNMSVEGDSNIVSRGRVTLNGVNMGNTNVDSTGYVTILSNRAEGNTFDGDLNVSGEYVSFGGFNEQNQTSHGLAKTVVNGDLNVTADQTIGYYGTVTANSMNFESANSSIVQANKDGVTSQLIADEITFTAPNGVAAALDANGSKNDYYVAMHEGYTASADRGAESYDALNTTARTEGGDLRLNVGAAVSNINADAEKTFVTNNGQNDIQDIKVSATGDLDVRDLTVVRNEADTAAKANTGNAKFEASNGEVYISDVNADSNITVRSSGKIDASNLVADNELNGYGKVDLNSDTGIQASNLQGDTVKLYSKGDIGASDLVSTGTTENWGISVVSQGNISIADAVSNRGISAYCTGSVDANGLLADADKNNSGTVYLSGNGVTAQDITGHNVNIANDQLEGGDIVLNNIVAEGDDNSFIKVLADGGSIEMNGASSTGDITVTGTPWSHDTQYVNVSLYDVQADSDRNGHGDLTVTTTGDANIDYSRGSNMTITAGGDAVVYNSRTYRDGQDDSQGNLVVNAGGDVTIGELLAETDIRVETENSISVIGDLLADRERNGVGDIYLHGQYLDGNGTANLGETGSITGANVTLIQDAQTDNLVLSNITATGNDGNILIDAPTDNIDLSNVHATGDVTVDNRSEDGYLDSAVLNNVIADSEGNGIGDLNIKTHGDIDATDVGGANVTLVSTDGNITVDGATSSRGDQSDESGNVTVIAENGDITIGNIVADTDVIGSAENGKVTVAGDLTADNEGNGVGDVILTGQELGGDNANLGETGAISGANVELNQSEYVETLVASNITATGNDGDVTFNVPTDNVDLSGIHATGDVTVNNGNEGNVLDSATLYDVYADSDRNKVGDLNIVTNGDINATSVGGANVNLESLEGNVTVDGGFATDDLIVTAKEGEANVTDAHADLDNDGVGDLVITGKDVTGDDLTGINIIVNADEDANLKDVITNGQGGHNIEITAGNDVNAENVSATDDVIITAGNDVNGENLVADNNQDGIGDLIINAGNNADVTGGSGENVDISADNNVTVNDITGADDVIITAGNDVNGENLVADGDQDGVGDLIINAGNNADVTGGSGENVEITAGEDVNAKDVTGADDVIITAGDQVTGENLVADGDEDGIGDLIINAGGDVDIDGGEGSNIYIETTGGSVDADDLTADGDDSIGNGKIVIIAPNGDIDVNGADANGDVDVTIGNGDLNLNDVTPDADGNGVGELIINRLGGDDDTIIDNSIADEVVKNLNNLEQVGVDTSSQAFTPIAFAADDDDDEASLAKRIAKIVFKTPSTGIVTITDKLSTLR